ncbi:hypothetical protein Aperf_G00000130067 [Anoplocephala perfoliata]
MSWPTEASFRNTTNSNVNDGEDVQPKIYLKQDVDFGSTREALENHMRNKTKKYCSCGPSLLQRKYCSSDFVVIAKKSSVKPQRFYPDPDWVDFNYAGLAVPLVVQEVLRGSDDFSKNIVVHFIQGSVCGVPSDMIPDGDGAYIIAARGSFPMGMRGLEALTPGDLDEQKNGEDVLEAEQQHVTTVKGLHSQPQSEVAHTLLTRRSIAVEYAYFIISTNTASNLNIYFDLVSDGVPS